MGTTHLSGFCLNGEVYAAADGPASTGTVSVPGVETGDTLLFATAVKAGTSGTLTAANIAASNMSVSAADTVTLTGTTAYSGYGITVFYLDQDA